MSKIYVEGGQGITGQYAPVDQYVSLEFDFAGVTPPSNEQLTINNAVYADATYVELGGNDTGGNSVASIVDSIKVGSLIKIQQVNEKAVFAIFRVNSVVDTNGIPVTHVAGQGTFDASLPLSLEIYRSNVVTAEFVYKWDDTEFVGLSADNIGRTALTLSAGMSCETSIIDPIVAFTGTGIGAGQLTASVGTDVPNQTRYQQAEDLTVITDTYIKLGKEQLTPIGDWDSSIAVRVYFKSLGADLEFLTAGEVSVRIELKNYK